jgi:hypothetical protein
MSLCTPCPHPHPHLTAQTIPHNPQQALHNVAITRSYSIYPGSPVVALREVPRIGIQARRRPFSVNDSARRTAKLAGEIPKRRPPAATSPFESHVAG